MNEPGGITTISGQPRHSLNVSPGFLAVLAFVRSDCAWLDAVASSTATRISAILEVAI
jgi:hypothetical protein